MRTAIMIGMLVGMLGCGDNSVRSAAVVSGVTVDAAADGATPDSIRDAAIDYGDACVMAMGNCGCIFEETIHYGADAGITSRVVCPDR